MKAVWHSAVASASVRRLIELAWRCLGAAVGVWIALWFCAPPLAPFLLASLGGSAVFLFGLTDAPAAQPRALFGGHLGCAVAGIACAQLLGSAPAVQALALAVSLCFMVVTKTMHPPAGANALLMVHAGAGWYALLQPVLMGVVCLALVAMAWSRCRRIVNPYPNGWWIPSPSGQPTS